MYKKVRTIRGCLEGLAPMIWRSRMVLTRWPVLETLRAHSQRRCAWELLRSQNRCHRVSMSRSRIWLTTLWPVLATPRASSQRRCVSERSRSQNQGHRVSMSRSRIRVTPLWPVLVTPRARSQRRCAWDLSRPQNRGHRVSMSRSRICSKMLLASRRNQTCCVVSSRPARLRRYIHYGVEVTELSTNKHHSFSLRAFGCCSQAG
jgi:hypothetical protein